MGRVAVEPRKTGRAEREEVGKITKDIYNTMSDQRSRNEFGAAHLGNNKPKYYSRYGYGSKGGGWTTKDGTDMDTQRGKGPMVCVCVCLRSGEEWRSNPREGPGTHAPGG